LFYESSLRVVVDSVNSLRGIINRANYKNNLCVTSFLTELARAHKKTSSTTELAIYITIMLAEDPFLCQHLCS